MIQNLARFNTHGYQLGFTMMIANKMIRSLLLVLIFLIYDGFCGTILQDAIDKTFNMDSKQYNPIDSFRNRSSLRRRCHNLLAW